MSLQLIVGGLADGSVYGAVALALVLIFRSTGILNFAQGEMATFTTLICWTLVVGRHIPYWIGFAIAIAFAFLLGGGVQRIFVEPIQRRGNHIQFLLVTLGLFYLFNTLSLKFWGPDTRPFPTPFPSGSVRIFGAYIGWVSVGILAASAGIMVLLTILFRFTKLGLAMRAVTANPTAASLMGINNNVMLAWAWGLASAVGTAAALLGANQLLLSPNMMQSVLLYAFAAAVLGGMTSPIGAVIGGLIIGVINAMAGTIPFIGGGLSTAVTFAVLIAILLLRPAGLFGKSTAVRV
jgi:branched-chain amino acid transport system permease protein